MKPTFAAAVALGVGLSFGTIAQGASEKDRVIGRAASSGDYAVTLASGNAKKPKQIKVTVTSSPLQKVSGNWTMVCSKGFGAGSKSGSFSARAPVTRRLRFPMRAPDSCTVSASGHLSGSGRIVVVLRART